MNWLEKLRYKYGRYYIQNLMTIVVAGMGIVYFLDMFFSAGGIHVSSYLGLDIGAVFRGQVWRLISFVFVYPSSGGFWLLISLYFYFSIGRSLEQFWGGFKLNVYYLFGIVGALVSALINYFLASALGFGGFIGTNTYLNTSLFLAFASLMPDAQFLLFFVVPVKAKWFLYGYAAITLVQLAQTFIFMGFWRGLFALITLVFSLLNYAVFFGPTLMSTIKEEMRIAQNRRNWQNRNKP